MAKMTKYVAEYGSNERGFTSPEVIWASNFELVTTYVSNHVAFLQNTAFGCDGARISEVKFEMDLKGKQIPPDISSLDVILG